MAKTTKVRDQDKFMLRLPDGMRDRIKLKADRAGMSMNEAIVWCLDRYFPAPRTFDDRVSDIVDMVAMLKNEGPDSAAIEKLIDTLDETLRDVSEGRQEVPVEFRHEISERLLQWDIERAEDADAKHSNPFDDGGDLDDGR